MRTVICAAVAAMLAASSAHAAIINVPGDEPTIQAGIDAAMSGDEVVVAQGEYFENIDFNGKAITVRSTDPNDAGVVANTIINGGGVLPNRVVLCGSGEGADTVLSGFVITGGNHFAGAGMLNFESSPTVTNCMFSGNTADFGGGMANQSNSPTITNCTFSENTALAGGGGMLNQLSSPTITNCTFSGNTSLFDGGGMANQNGSSPTVTNCTFSDNAADFDGGGMFNNGSSPTVTNCVLWGNSPVEFGGSGVPIVSYSNVQGGWPGTANIDADPLFVDPDNGDYRLSPGSLCIDSGANNANATTTDLDGNPRFVDDPATPDCPQPDAACGFPPVIDMGAYEFQGASSCPWDCGGDDDGNVGIVDFLDLLANWGPCP